MLDATNAARAQDGLSPLVWSAPLADAAQKHAEEMASAQSLTHQLPREPDVPTRTAAAGAHFQAVAENVAYGYSTTAIVNQWLHSAPHRSNILNPKMNAVGIALVANHGTLWAVEDFAARVDAMAPADVEQTVASALGLAVAPQNSPEHAAAVAACPQFEGTGGVGARFIVRWESADMHTLPGPLASVLASHQYTRAAVAACPAANTRNQSFTAYRVAVLLF